MCRQLMLQNPQVTISYVPRDCNQAANAMAAITSRDHISLKWNGTPLPHHICPVLVMDICIREEVVVE